VNHFGSLRSPSFSVVTLSDPGVARKNLNGIAPQLLLFVLDTRPQIATKRGSFATSSMSVVK